MVGHQAIGEHLEAVLVALLLQQREVCPPVVVDEELPQSSECMILIAMMNLMSRRLARCRA